MTTPRASGRRCRMAGAALVLFALGADVARAADDAYRAASGDVLEIAVRGLPELQRRVPIAVDGTISLPGVGVHEVAGLSLAELRSTLKRAIVMRIYAMRSLDAAGAIDTVEADDVHVAVAEFRPIYVKGDVARSGEFPYRGPMSVRQAIALSGGNQAGALSDSHMLALDLAAEEESLWHELVKERARSWRLGTELGTVTEPIGAVIERVPGDAPIARERLADIADLAERQLAARRLNDEREHRSLAEIIAQLGEEIRVTGSQLEAEERAHAADQDELKNLTTLKQQGVVNPQRFADTRRAVLFSSTRILQANVRLTEAKRIMSERQLQKQKLTDERKAMLLQELEASQLRIGVVEARLRAIDAKAPHVAGLSAAARPPARRLIMTIHRRKGALTESIAATEATEMLPGDVLEVLIAPSQGSMASVPAGGP